MDDLVEFLGNGQARYRGQVMPEWRLVLVLAVQNPERYAEIMRGAPDRDLIAEHGVKRSQLDFLEAGNQLVSGEAEGEGLLLLVEGFFKVCDDEMTRRGLQPGSARTIH